MKDLKKTVTVVLEGAPPLQNDMEDFYKRIYEIVKQIPAGRVTTYGAIAAATGAPGAARMVGWAMNASHYSPEFIPAHRVVNRNGLLTGRHHFTPPSAMQELLENEGIIVNENQIADFESRFWDPLKELDIMV
jgi:methylated-DNA-protein-cysteine methyltransferase-like protein